MYHAFAAIHCTINCSVDQGHRPIYNEICRLGFEGSHSTVDSYIIKYPVYGHMIQFGIDYHCFMDNNDPDALMALLTNTGIALIGGLPGLPKDF